MKMLAPAANQQFVAKSGNAYTSDQFGVIASVAIGDIESMANANYVPLDTIAGNTLLGHVLSANFNSASADQPFIMFRPAMLFNFRLTKITVKNASVSLTTAAGGIYTAASQGGTAVVASGQAYTALTAASLALDLTIATTPGKTVYAAGQALYLNLTTAQGAAATADVYAWGDVYV